MTHDLCQGTGTVLAGRWRLRWPGFAVLTGVAHLVCGPELPAHLNRHRSTYHWSRRAVSFPDFSGTLKFIGHAQIKEVLKVICVGEVVGCLVTGLLPGVPHGVPNARQHGDS